MDKRDLVEGLQKAFNYDDRSRNTTDISDVEYKENTNSLYVKKQKTYSADTKEVSLKAMTEEEVFARLLKERR